MGRNCTCALGALLALAVSIAGLAGEPAKPESPLDQAKRLAASEKKPERVQALGLLKALAKPGNAQGDEAAWRYADLCLRFHGEGEAGALAEARKAFESIEKGAGSRWGLRGKIGLYRVDAAGGKRDEAIKGLDRFLGQQTKCERAVEAAYYLGGIYADRKPGEKDEADHLRLARTALGYALKLHEAVSRYNAPVVSADEIRRKLEAVKRRLWEIEAGRLKVLFEKAENLRKAKKYDEAIKVYEEIRKEFPGHDLTELSGLRICECTFQKKDLQGAVAKAKVFIAEDPLGAYRGHAHLLIGDIHLEHLFDIANSEPEFRCVLEPEKAPPVWLKDAHAAVLARRRTEKEPPALAEKADKTWLAALPHAHERVGILEYLRKNAEKAAEHFDTSQRLAPNQTYGDDPNQGMAELADKIRRKKEIMPDSLLGERCQRTTLVLLLASLYMEGWRDDRSMTLLRRVISGEFKEASLHQKAYAKVKLAEGLYYKGEDKEATKILREFESQPFYGTAFAARALLQLAVVTNRDDRFDEAVTYLDKCHARDPYSELGQWAFYQKAFGMYAKDRNRQALRLFREYAALYPNSFHVKEGHVAYFVKKLEKSIAAEEKTPQ